MNNFTQHVSSLRHEISVETKTYKQKTPALSLDIRNIIFVEIDSGNANSKYEL